MIQIQHLCKSFDLPNGQVAEVLKHIDLEVPDRSITAVIGPSGAGKTTLSRCISLLEKPSSGSVWVNGTDLSALTGSALQRARRSIGTIFQSSALLRRRTAAENIALPLEYLGVTPSEIRARCQALLDKVGLPDKADFYPDQLSGGQRQRVGIARALALHPQVLLADEATSGLDPEATESILDLLKQLRDEFGLSIILITHEMDVVRSIADNVAVIAAGRIVEQGRVRELIANPQSQIGRQLLPIKPRERQVQDQLLLEVTYSAHASVPEDWISLIAERLQTRVSLLGGSIEQIDGRLSGRVRIGLSLETNDENTIESLQTYLSGLGLIARWEASHHATRRVTTEAA